MTLLEAIVTLHSLGFYFSVLVALGNCIWYDEPSLLQNIRKKLNTVVFKEVPFPNMTLPVEIKAILKSARLSSSQEVASGSLLTNNQQVRDLVALEKKSQSEYFNLKLCLQSYTNV